MQILQKTNRKVIAMKPLYHLTVPPGVTVPDGPLNIAVFAPGYYRGGATLHPAPPGELEALIMAVGENDVEGELCRAEDPYLRGFTNGARWYAKRENERRAALGKSEGDFMGRINAEGEAIWRVNLDGEPEQLQPEPAPAFVPLREGEIIQEGDVAINTNETGGYLGMIGVHSGAIGWAYSADKHLPIFRPVRPAGEADANLSRLCTELGIPEGQPLTDRAANAIVGLLKRCIDAESAKPPEPLADWEFETWARQYEWDHKEKAIAEYAWQARAALERSTPASTDK